MACGAPARGILHFPPGLQKESWHLKIFYAIVHVEPETETARQEQVYDLQIFLDAAELISDGRHAVPDDENAWWKRPVKSQCH